MSHTGGCHCGRIAYRVEADIDQVMDCNCSMCRKRGGLLWFVPRDALHLTGDAQASATYTFNTHKIQHHFCTTCGIAPYSEGQNADGSAMACINVRCLDDIDLKSLTVVELDGRSF